jgi:hypothetical protein
MTMTMEPTPAADGAKRLSSSAVSMMLAERWQLPCGREALARVSEQLRLETRETPRAHRRWTVEQVERIALALVVKRSMAPEVADALIESGDYAKVEQIAALLDPAKFGMPALLPLPAKQTTAA